MGGKKLGLGVTEKRTKKIALGVTTLGVMEKKTQKNRSRGDGKKDTKNRSRGDGKKAKKKLQG